MWIPETLVSMPMFSLNPFVLGKKKNTINLQFTYLQNKSFTEKQYLYLQTITTTYFFQRSLSWLSVAGNTQNFKIQALLSYFLWFWVKGFEQMLNNIFSWDYGLGHLTRISGMKSPSWCSTLYHYLGADATLDEETTWSLCQPWASRRVLLLSPVSTLNARIDSVEGTETQLHEKKSGK